MLGEYKTGQGWTQYLYFNGAPVAMVRGGAIGYIHGDHLGRPEIVTNETKAVTWRASNYAFERTVMTDTIGGLNLERPEIGVCPRRREPRGTAEAVAMSIVERLGRINKRFVQTLTPHWPCVCRSGGPGR